MNGCWNYGGKGTLLSYLEHADKKGRYFASGSGFKTSMIAADIPETHKDFFNSQELYYIDKKRRCFVHGGFKREVPFKDQRTEDYYWDRTLWSDAVDHKNAMRGRDQFIMATKFREIYIGHSPTTHWGTDKPIRTFNIINMDTGAGHSGKLTILGVASKKFWQSDPLPELYLQWWK